MAGRLRALANVPVHRPSTDVGQRFNGDVQTSASPQVPDIQVQTRSGIAFRCAPDRYRTDTSVSHS